MNTETLNRTIALPYVAAVTIDRSDLLAYYLFLKEGTIPGRPLKQLIGEPADINDFDAIHGWVLRTVKASDHPITSLAEWQIRLRHSIEAAAAQPQSPRAQHSQQLIDQLRRTSRTRKCVRF